MICLSDCNGIQTHNHLVHRETLTNLAEVYPPLFTEFINLTLASIEQS